MNQALQTQGPVRAGRVLASRRTQPGLGEATGGWSLAAGVYAHSQSKAHALALSSEDGPLSYAQLARQAAGLARHLHGSGHWPQNGAVPRVGVLASRSAQACIAALGAAWAGATYVPLGLSWPAERIVQVMRRCGVCALVADAQGARLLAPALLAVVPQPVLVLGAPPPAPVQGAVRWLPAHELAAEPVQPPRPLCPRDTAYILFTSGSTGEPKGVMVPVGAVRHYQQAMGALLDLQPSDRVLDIFELGFDVSVHNMLCTWAAGASLHQLPPARVMNAVGFVREQDITVWNSVPSLVGLLQQVKALTPGALPRLRLSTFGGEQLTRSVVQAWRQAAPASRIYNLYGPTEATVTCMAQRVDADLPVLEGSDVLAIGQPLPGSQTCVLGPDGQAMPAGQVGELAIAGAQLASGYLDAPALTAERFVWREGQRWYLTGDLVRCDDAGRFYCLGRLDHQVKVRGHRVELEDIDAHLRRVMPGAMVATVAWPLHEGGAQGLVGFVSGPGMDGAAALKALRTCLPAYMLPSRVVCLPQLPLSTNGKVDRRALCQWLEAGQV